MQCSLEGRESCATTFSGCRTRGAIHPGRCFILPRPVGGTSMIPVPRCGDGGVSAEHRARRARRIPAEILSRGKREDANTHGNAGYSRYGSRPPPVAPDQNLHPAESHARLLAQKLRQNTRQPRMIIVPTDTGQLPAPHANHRGPHGRDPSRKNTRGTTSKHTKIPRTFATFRCASDTGCTTFTAPDADTPHDRAPATPGAWAPPANTRSTRGTRRTLRKPHDLQRVRRGPDANRMRPRCAEMARAAARGELLRHVVSAVPALRTSEKTRAQPGGARGTAPKYPARSHTKPGEAATPEAPRRELPAPTPRTIGFVGPAPAGALCQHTRLPATPEARSCDPGKPA